MCEQLEIQSSIRFASSLVFPDLFCDSLSVTNSVPPKTFWAQCSGVGYILILLWAMWELFYAAFYVPHKTAAHMESLVPAFCMQW